MYRGPPESPVNTQLRGDVPAATSHEWSPMVALYLVTLEGSFFNANVTIKDVEEIPLTLTCGRAEKTAWITNTQKYVMEKVSILTCRKCGDF